MKRLGVFQGVVDSGVKSKHQNLLAQPEGCKSHGIPGTWLEYGIDVHNLRGHKGGPEGISCVRHTLFSYLHCSWPLPSPLRHTHTLIQSLPNIEPGPLKVSFTAISSILSPLTCKVANTNFQTKVESRGVLDIFNNGCFINIQTSGLPYFQS